MLVPRTDEGCGPKAVSEAYRCGSTSICEDEPCGGGDVAYRAAGDVPSLSVVDSFEKAVSASGKLGGVAGVFAGVHI